MERLKDLLSGIDKTTLVRKLANSEYAFASWKKPESTESHLIVSLSIYDQTTANISELETGFVINKFDDHHPAYPYHIKADLIFGQDDIRIDPRVTAQQLDSFEKAIRSESSNIEKSHRTVNKVTSCHFEQAVQKAINEISNGTFEKVVLSRFKDVTFPQQSFSLSIFFDRLCDLYPDAFCSMVHLPNQGLWIGATPELLISDNTNRFKTIALAGTKKLEANQPLSEIAWTQKEIEEQAFVSRYVINCFKQLRLREFHEHGPKTIRAGSLVHLKTEFEVRYDEVSFDGLADQMLNLLHPTSAVCGMPLEQATSFIKDTESHDRLFYSGFLGSVNFNESTDLFVNLRCMNIFAKEARLFAGAGITQDSNPEKEMLETELKMETLMNIIYP